MNTLNFDYYYGLEGEQFQYIKIPKLIVQDEVFHNLSDRAKILYGILLDRMSLSRTNKWLDEQNRVYILFSIKGICKALNCSKPTACKALAELDSESGIGLIEKKKRGQGKPDIIYVKNFISYAENNPEVGKKMAWNPDNINGDFEDETIEDIDEEAENTEENSEVKKLYLKESNSLNSKAFTSRDKESLPTEVKGVSPNNTEYSKTNINNTEYKEIYEREREELNPAVHLSGNFCLSEEVENRLAEQFEINPDIPVGLAYDTEEMTKVIMYLSDWNECIASQDVLFRESYRLVVENLIELATMLDAQTIKGRNLSYNSVIYILNDIMKCDIADEDRKLKFFVTRTVEKYMDILKHKTVGNQKKYIRSVIVDNFGTYRMEWEASIQKSSYDFSKPKKKVDDFSWLED